MNSRGIILLALVTEDVNQGGLAVPGKLCRHIGGSSGHTEGVIGKGGVGCERIKGSSVDLLSE